MLATPTQDGWNLARYIVDSFWALEQKVDGRRRMVEVGEGQLVGRNRTGEPADLPRDVAAAFERLRDLPERVVFDGELLDGKLWLFDLPAVPGVRTGSYVERRATLASVVDNLVEGDAVEVLPVAFGEEAKQRLAAEVIRQGGEGFVAKHIESIYEPGKRGRRWVKVKLTADVDCVVTAVSPTGKDNMVVALWDGDRLVEVGEVTRLAGDGAHVKAGDVVAVQVLYATVDNRLYQPTRPRIRTDKRPEECTIDQLDTVRVNKEIVRL